MKDCHVLVIGAGMGGLTTALALQRAGLSVKVYETAPVLSEVGAGLTISSNATRALEYVGLGPFMEEAGDKPGSGGLIHYRTGEILFQTQMQNKSFKERFGAEYYQIHRADLHDALAAAVRANDPDAILLNHTFTGLEQDADGITATFAGGATARGDALIGADGLRSSVRAALFPDLKPPTFTHQVSFRGTMTAEAAAPFMQDGPKSAVTIGPHHIFTRYYMRHGALVNLVAIAHTDAWKEEGWSTPATRAELRAEYEGWNDNVMGLIDAVPEDKLYKWALFDRDPLDTWTVGRATLLGDAAHPMLPFLGMGAAMALEDAVICARCLEAGGTVAEAFKRYEAARLERTTKVLLDSRVQGELYQQTDPDAYAQTASKTELRIPLFAYDPATVEI